jgi:rod shape-determining protein MreC
VERWISNRPHAVAFSVVLLGALTALSLPERHALRAKLLWGSVFMPLVGLAASINDLVDHAAQATLPRTTLARQLDALRRENDRLRFEGRQSEAIRLENERLRQAIGWRAQLPWRLRLTRVIGQDPSNWWRSIWIDLGSREGLQPNQSVLTGDGLVGRVAEVGFTRARVVLVGDPNCRFSAQVESTRDKGIIAPDEASFDRQVVNFTYVPTIIELRPGAGIVTSGEGGVFPKGLPVGRIIDVQTNQFGLYLEARVRLSVNLNRLEEVWVMFP